MILMITDFILLVMVLYISLLLITKNIHKSNEDMSMIGLVWSVCLSLLITLNFLN